MSSGSTARRSVFRRKPVEAFVTETRPDAEGGELERSIGLFQLTLFGVGATIGTGIFIVLTEAVPEAGPAVIVSFILAGITAALTAVCYELISREATRFSASLSATEHRMFESPQNGGSVVSRTALEKTEQLQRTVFGVSDRDLASSSILVTVHETGREVLGDFDVGRGGRAGRAPDPFDAYALEERFLDLLGDLCGYPSSPLREPYGAIHGGLPNLRRSSRSGRRGHVDGTHPDRRAGSGSSGLPLRFLRPPPA